MKTFKICLIILFLVASGHLTTLAQLKNFNTEVDRWLPGKVVLFDGTELKGSINFNFITGIVSLRNGQKVQTFLPNKASYFDWGEPDEKVRQYYSLPLERNYGKEQEHLFFEVVYQNESIAILSRHLYDYKLRGTGGGRSDVPVKEDRTIEIEKVSEYLYLANGNDPIVDFANRKKDKSTTFIYDTENELDRSKYEYSITARNENDEYRITYAEAYKIIGGDNYEEFTSTCESEGYQLNTLKGLIYYIDLCQANIDKP